MTATFAKALLRPLRNAVRDHVFWVRQKKILETDLSAVAESAPVAAVQYRFGSELDIGKLTEVDHEYNDEARAYALERLRHGDRVVLGELNGELVFYGWLMFSAMDLDYRNYVPLPPEYAYCYKLFTLKHLRGKKILPGFYSFLKKSLPVMGYRKLVCWVYSDNHASLRSHRNVGFKATGTIYNVRVVNRLFLASSRGPQAGHPSRRLVRQR